MPRPKRHFVVHGQWAQVGGVNPIYWYRGGLPAYQEGGGYSGKEPYQEGGFLPSLISMAAPHVLHAGKKLACKGAREAVEKYCPPKKRKKSQSQSGDGHRAKKRRKTQKGGKLSDILSLIPLLGPLAGGVLKQVGLGHRRKTIKKRQRGGFRDRDLLNFIPFIGPLVNMGIDEEQQRGRGRLQLRQPWDPPPPFLPVPQSGLGRRRKQRRHRRATGKKHCFAGLP